jgi:hypothetical protein
LENKRQEAQRQRLLAEQRRQQAAFDRLRHELKDMPNGASSLTLKDVGMGPDLRLKLSDATVRDTGPGGLKLKLDDGESTTAAANGCKSTGIPGLPGLYLNDCVTGTTHTSALVGTGDPIQLALAARPLSGIERAAVEERALEAAEVNLRLLAPPDDPRLTDFQSADVEYRKALVAQTNAAQSLEQARQQAETVQEAAKIAQASVAKQQTTGQAPPPEVKQALDNLNAAGKTNEEISVRAEQEFTDATAKVTITRSNAIGHLVAMAPTQPGTQVIDLRDKQQPLVVHPEQLHPAGAYNGPIGSPPSVPSRVTVTPNCPTATDAADSALYNRGLVLGLTAVGGLNVPPGSRNATALCQEETQRFHDMQEKVSAPATPESRLLSASGYDFIIGLAKSTDLLSSDPFYAELARGILAEYLPGQLRPYTNENYPSLRGRHFKVLECHSNGAMVCLYDLKEREITAHEVRLLGPQITLKSLTLWSQLVSDHIVDRVDIFWMTRDPVPIATLGFAALGPDAFSLGPLLESTVGGYRNLQFHVLQCPIPLDLATAEVTECHNARFYQNALSRPR